MKRGKFRAVLASLLAFALTLPPWASCAGYRCYYTFSDRHGNTIAALEDAFASKVLLFTPGDPWTEREENQKPENALGLPDAKGDDGDLNLGGGGVLVVELGLPIYDGSGYDLFVFEAGSGGAEEMQIAVSDDLATWYNVGTLSGSVTEADLHGITPEGASFRYVRLTDAGNSNGGAWPGADIDAVCALNALTADDIPTVYRFRDRQGVYRGAAETSFAVRVVDFTHGDPWTEYAKNQSLGAPLGLPDYYVIGGTPAGDLNLGAGGSLTLEFEMPLRDGTGADVYVFEAGGTSAEEAKVEVSDDLQTWFDAGSVSGSKLWVDLNGVIPVGKTFRYVRLTDLSNAGGAWPGADIDAVCGLHAEPELFHFADKHGVPYSVPSRAFAARVEDFVPGTPWTNSESSRKIENALGLPDSDGNNGELALGGGGVVTLAFDVELYDGSGLDVFVFEIAAAVESTRVEVSADLQTWYEVGVSEGGFSGVDIAGKVPDGFGFSYVRLTDLRDAPSGTWPGADIDAVCGLHTREKAGSAYPYRINSVLVQNETGRITKEEMSVAVSVTKLAQPESASVFLVACDERGQMTGSVASVAIDGRSVGETFDVAFPVDNRAGNVAQLRAFIVSAAPDMVPLSYPFAYAAKE
ncbi:MAG: hypothetical protein IKO14_06890 [Oscillibacter sp.]|nr:hypothetical protein [Oscillibacter sp.]